MKIIVCGKGGSGKSTVAALLASAMHKRGKSIFLVDADESNIGLYRMLGLDMPVPLMDSLGGKKGFRGKTKSTGVALDGPLSLFPPNLTLQNLPDRCIASFGRMRVMSIGKIQHFAEGCACPMGSLFRMLFSSLSFEKQDLVMVDTAAGVEHFGRSLDGQCDHVFCIVDPSYESIMMAKRVEAFASEARLPVSIILNKITPDVDEDLTTALEGVAIIGRLPDHRSLFLNNLKGRALDSDMPEIEAVCDSIEQAWV
ncbi:MAG: P-loop NTPase [Thermodesulfobacteriota bacterium]|nr:P-loop NTPase [Thermodesulfobacteriota bacterium]